MLEQQRSSVQGLGGRSHYKEAQRPPTPAPPRACLQFQLWPLDGRAAQSVVVHRPDRDVRPSGYLPLGRQPPYLQLPGVVTRPGPAVVAQRQAEVQAVLWVWGEAQLAPGV